MLLTGMAPDLKKYLTMNIGYSEDKNDATYTICVNNEEIKTVGTLELLCVILISLIISAQFVSRGQSKDRTW